MNRSSHLAVFGALAVALTGCPRDKDDDSLTYAEALEAANESAADSQAQGLTSDSIEITTDFQLGDAVEAAAAQIRDFVATQLPCADLTLTGATLEVTYGAKPGNCVYHGHTFSGSHTVTVAKAAAGGVEVHHTWDRLSNGMVEVTGDATVTWTLADPARHVVHDVTWTRLSDGRTGTGTGDRFERPLAQGLATGISIDGDRTWTGAGGKWTLDIGGVSLRWVDPVPQSGSYTLHTPKGKSLRLGFDRKDADTITVSISSGSKRFAFDVTSVGNVG